MGVGEWGVGGSFFSRIDIVSTIMGRQLTNLVMSGEWMLYMCYNRILHCFASPHKAQLCHNEATKGTCVLCFYERLYLRFVLYCRYFFT